MIKLIYNENGCSTKSKNMSLYPYKYLKSKDIVFEALLEECYFEINQVGVYEIRGKFDSPNIFLIDINNNKILYMQTGGYRGNDYICYNELGYIIDIKEDMLPFRIGFSICNGVLNGDSNVFIRKLK